MAMVMATCLVMLNGMLAVGRHKSAGGLVMVAIMLGRHVLRRGRAGSLTQMMLLGGHVGRGDGRDAVGGHRVLHLIMVAGPRREGRSGMGAATHVGMATLSKMGSGMMVVPPRSAGALVLTLLVLAHGGAGSTITAINSLCVCKIGWALAIGIGRTWL